MFLFVKTKQKCFKQKLILNILDTSHFIGNNEEIKEQ